jgi:hypothetical protein
MSHNKNKPKIIHMYKTLVILMLLYLLFPQDEHIGSLNIHCWMMWVSSMLCVALV